MDKRMFLLIAMFSIPTALALASSGPLQLTSWTASNSIVDVGQYETLIALATNTTPAVNYNLIIYNSIGEQMYLYSQPDVLVQYPNGIIVGYNASENTNTSRGQALLNAFTPANLSNGISIYLKSETYDIGFNNLNQSYANMTGIKLYGAGKYRTTIISEYGGLGNSKSIIEMGRNSVTADLSIIANSTYVNDAWGISSNGDPGESFGNSTLRNVYIQVQSNSEGVGIGMGGNSYSGVGIGNIIIENVTVKTQGSSIGMYILSPPAFLYPPGYNGLVLVFDSTINSNNGTIPEAFSCADLCNAIVVNDNFTALGGSSSSYGLVTYNNGRMMVYGGKVGTAGGTALDLYNEGSSLGGDDITYLAVDSSVSYNALKTSGTINSIVGGYGPYSYQGYPMAPPSTANTYTYLQQPSFGTGVFTANLTVTDYTDPSSQVTNILTYTVNPQLAVGAITPQNAMINLGQGIMMTETWGGGTPPYNSIWYSGASANCTNDTNIAATYNDLQALTTSLNVSPSSPTYYCVGITDNATTRATSYSAADLVNVSAAPAPASSTSTASTIEYNTGGLPPRTPSIITIAPATTVSTTVTTTSTILVVQKAQIQTTTATTTTAATTTLEPTPPPSSSPFGGISKIVQGVIRFFEGLLGLARP